MNEPKLMSEELRTALKSEIDVVGTILDYYDEFENLFDKSEYEAYLKSLCVLYDKFNKSGNKED